MQVLLGEKLLSDGEKGPIFLIQKPRCTFQGTHWAVAKSKCGVSPTTSWGGP